MKNNSKLLTICCAIALVICLCVTPINAFAESGDNEKLNSLAYPVTDGYIFINLINTPVISLINEFGDKSVIKDREGNPVTTGIVGTGMTVSLMIDETIVDSAIIVVNYDLDGDGTVNATDISLLKRNLLGIDTLNSAQQKAISGANSDAIDIRDLIRIKKYLANYVKGLSDSVFASTVSVSDKVLYSLYANWNLDNISANIVKASNQFGTSVATPLYFANTSDRAVIHTTVTRTDDRIDAETQPMIAVIANSGTSTGYIGIRAGAVMINGVWNNGLIGKDVLTTWSSADDLSIDFDVMLKDGYFYVYVDNNLLQTYAVSDVVPGATSETEFAFGLITELGQKAAFDISDISISTNTTEFENSHNTLFVKQTLLGENTVWSSLPNWDLTNVADNKIGASTTLGTSTGTPLYFANTSDRAVIHTTVTRTDDRIDAETQPMIAVIANSGTSTGYIGIRAGAVMINGVWNNGLIGKDVLTTWSSADDLSIDFDVMLKDGYFYVYVDNNLLQTYAVSDVVPGATSETEFAFGLITELGQKAAFDISDIEFSTNTATANAFSDE